MIRLEYPVGSLPYEDLLYLWYKDATSDDILVAAREGGKEGKSAIIVSKSQHGEALISHFCLKHLPNDTIKVSRTEA